MLTTDYNQLTNRLKHMEEEREEALRDGNFLSALLFQGHIDELIAQFDDELDKKTSDFLYCHYIEQFACYDLESYLITHFGSRIANLLLEQI